MSQLIIGIPGSWKDQSDIITAVAEANTDKQSPRFLAIGGLIMDMHTNQTFGFEVYEHDSRLAQMFAYAGQGRFTDEELNKISEHKHTVYLVCGEPFASPNRENLDAARCLLELGRFLLDAGGFAVKVENSGIAHPADRWRHYADQNTTLAIYDAFVTMVGGDDFNYTCGMHALGMPDVSLTKDVPIEEAPALLNGFNQYQLLEAPSLSDGDLFATSLSTPLLKMTHCPYGYKEDDLLNNPYGRWHLELSETTHDNQTKYHERDEPLFMAMRSDDLELEATVEQARSSLPWFLAQFTSPYEYGYYLIKTHIQDGDESAYVWTGLVDIKDDCLIVALFEIPSKFANLKSGQKLSITIEEVYDWSIHRNGTLIGGFSQRLQREHVPENERRQYDLYSGTIAFTPIDEVLRSSESRPERNGDGL
ncbi:DUF2314 domain-containing protein [Aeoliella mucimassa]|uniref:DUF2314 domain-containing protein n=1 Tax=Aeoliella mucimassa TaxID=2527972 RepID=A0A518AIZ8_9BACT|nr:DUF2314 domain-containing protein [Aeoliella mucimassa]QDU54670.1 hypothetical protein Pan181_08530 [Aeoliella mucimassa]